MDKIIRAENLGKVYKKNKKEFKALEGINFTLETGEFVGIMGESGSGKTTLMNILTGLEEKSSGELSMADKLSFHMVFQNPTASFNPRMTIGRSLEEGMRNRGIPEKEREKRIQELLKLCGLAPTYLQSYPHELSGGQCQRAALVRALLGDPKVLICDEMTSALDTVTKKQVMELVLKLAKERKMTLIVVDHDLALLAHMCTRLIVMEKGRIVEDNSVDEVLDHPKAEYTQRLIAAAML